MARRWDGRSMWLLFSVCLAGLFAAQARAQGPTNVLAVPTGQADKGEPYDLGGKRIIFSTWMLVRPGHFVWVDARGENVTVGGNQGPTEAFFRRAESPQGIRLVAQPAERRRVDWNGPGYEANLGVTISTLLHDGDTYRAWGVVYGDRRSLLYYESRDGWHWERPAVQFTVDGRPDVAINLLEGSIFIDPSAPAEERYKCVVLESFSDEEYEAFRRKYPDRWEPLARREDVGRVFHIAGLVSPDGFAWRRLPEPLVVEHSDSQITACYDPRLRKYVIYTRSWMIDPRAAVAETGGHPFHYIGRRSIGRTESSDFRSFPLSQQVLVPGPDLEPSDVLYTNARTAIPGMPWSHLMFPAVWHCDDDSTTILLAASHDGRVWNYLPGREVFRTAPFGEWDGGCVFARPNLVELPDGTFVLPYTGYDVPHKYPRGQFKYTTGYLVWPRGRIIALQADGLGEFSTVAFVAPGEKLLLNADIRRAGNLSIEVARLDGRAIAGRTFADCDPLFGDLYRHPVTWKGQPDLGCPAGTPIILRFRMDHARIFTLDFE